MPYFRYHAINSDGSAIDGEIEAPSIDKVIARLQGSGALPIRVEPMAQAGAAAAGALSGGSRLRRTARSAPSVDEVGVLTAELATLLGAGLPLDRALQVLGEIAASPRVARTVADVRDRVRGGATLSDALDAQGGTFSRLYVSMVRAGEAGGTLDETLRRLAVYMERSREVRESIVSAMIYPVLLMIMALASLFILLTFVVPQFTAMFDDLGARLPLSTRIVVGAGELLRDHWILLFATIGALIVLLRWQLSLPRIRLRFDAWLLRRALIGELIRQIDTARLARTLGSLLLNGVPLLSALSAARGVLVNTALAEAVDRTTEAVRNGKGFGGPLGEVGVFPPMAVHMVRLGEETGRLDEMLIEVADTFERDSRRTVDRLLALMVPVMILVLALLIGGIVVSILLAIISANELLL